MSNVVPAAKHATSRQPGSPQVDKGIHRVGARTPVGRPQTLSDVTVAKKKKKKMTQGSTYRAPIESVAATASSLPYANGPL